MIQKKIISFLIVVCGYSFVFSQYTKETLQKQNAEIKKQIAAINNNLAKSQAQSRLSVSYLQGLNQKLTLREKVYTNTQKEKRFIEDDIYKRQLEINQYNKELGVLREQYAQILIKAYKNKGVQNKVTFILSARNLGEALRRVQYLKQYSEFQDKKANEITNKTTQIKSTIGLREKSKLEKQNLLVNQEKDLNIINTEKQQKEKLLQDFKQNEAKLTAELRQKQAESKKLEGEIRNIIKAEIAAAKAKAEAEKKAEAERIRLARIEAAKEKARIDAENKKRIAEAAEAKRKAEIEERKALELARKRAEDEKRAIEKNKSEERRIAAENDKKEAEDRARVAKEKADAARAAEVAINKKNEDAKKAAEDRLIKNATPYSSASSDFASARGSMMFPARGNITHRFGRQQHPVFKNIQEENTGIKIAVSPGTKAKAVFAGTVSQILYTGGAKTVMVKHGEYFTIYSNLSNVSVAKNQQVSAGTSIGEIGTDFDGAYTLDFQVWRGDTPMDPLGWIAN